MPDVELLLLGVAQDAGVPQLGCSCRACSRVRQGLDPQQYATSMAIISHAERCWWLLDCSPDIKHQYDMVQQQAAGYRLAGVLLTHLHMGHYLGLAQFGREAMDIKGLQVMGTPSVCTALSSNKPWSTYTAAGNFVLQPFQPCASRPTPSASCNDQQPLLHPQQHLHTQQQEEQQQQQQQQQQQVPQAVPQLVQYRGVSLGAHVMVTPLAVPHRAEFSDCVMFSIQGPSKRMLYCPDIDSWQAFADSGAGRIQDLVADSDLAFLDATFYSHEELPPGRDPAEIPHPLVTDSMARLAAVAGKTVFVHLNHTNPLWDASSQQHAAVVGAGFGIGQQGDKHTL